MGKFLSFLSRKLPGVHSLLITLSVSPYLIFHPLETLILSGPLAPGMKGRCKRGLVLKNECEERGGKGFLVVPLNSVLTPTPFSRMVGAEPSKGTLEEKG